MHASLASLPGSVHRRAFLHRSLRDDGAPLTQRALLAPPVARAGDHGDRRDALQHRHLCHDGVHQRCHQGLAQPASQRDGAVHPAAGTVRTPPGRGAVAAGTLGCAVPGGEVGEGKSRASALVEKDGLAVRHALLPGAGHTESLTYEKWPEYDESLLVLDTVTLPVQINGKVRGKVDVPPNLDEAGAVEAAMAQPNVAKFTEGKTVKKVIYKAGKILNLIVA
eukprot:365306-Chlamydomonas_euryale.AAC.10